VITECETVTHVQHKVKANYLKQAEQMIANITKKGLPYS